MSDPASVMAAIDADARALDAASTRLGKAIKDLADVEMEYERQVQSQLIVIYHEAKESKERMPAEDVRNALAHRAIPNGVYGAYLAGKAEVEALKAFVRATESKLSARQSLLSALKTESMAA